jgi:hypothetical protein
MKPYFRKGRLVDGVVVEHLNTHLLSDTLEDIWAFWMDLKVQSCRKRLPHALYTVMKRCIRIKNDTYKLRLLDRDGRHACEKFTFPLKKQKIFEFAKNFKSNKSIYRIYVTFYPETTGTSC